MPCDMDICTQPLVCAPAPPHAREAVRTPLHGVDTVAYRAFRNRTRGCVSTFSESRPTQATLISAAHGLAEKFLEELPAKGLTAIAVKRQGLEHATEGAGSVQIRRNRGAYVRLNMASCELNIESRRRA